jgi:hypothetical protein
LIEDEEIQPKSKLDKKQKDRNLIDDMVLEPDMKDLDNENEKKKDTKKKGAPQVSRTRTKQPQAKKQRLAKSNILEKSSKQIKR